MSYRVATVAELQDIPYRQDTHMRPVRHHLGITAFGTNAWTAVTPGDRLMPEHAEDEGVEELYVVLRGRARFEIDGDTVDAPTGALVFVGPETSRTAFAEEAGTTVLAVGSRIGQPYEAGGWEVWAEFHPAYEAGDYEGVIERGRGTLENAGYATPLYNLACCEAQTGRTEEAIDHLRVAIERRPSLRDFAKEDTDFDPLRDETAFRELIGEPVAPRDRMSTPIASLSEFYEQHHAAARNHGAFVFVPERIPFFKRALGAPGKRILDLGCRSGAVAQHFVEGNEVVGLDVDRVALEEAEKLGIETVVADVEATLPFPDKSFDAVIAGELLEHVRFPENVVADARRLLRPGGIFVGSVPNMFNLHNRLAFLRGQRPDPDPTHLHMLSPEAVSTLLEAFDDVHMEFFGGRFIRLHRRLLSWDIAFRARRRP